MNSKRLLLPLFAMALVAFAPIVSHASEEYLMRADLSNFDVVNRSGDSARSFDMILTNMSCTRIYDWWRNTSGYTPGIGTISMVCSDLGGGSVSIHFTWSGAAVAKNSTAHFGLSIDQISAPPPLVEKAYWDNGQGTQIGQAVDFAWVYWSETVLDPVHIRIRRPDILDRTDVKIANAQWAQTPVFLGLNHMTPSDPLIIGLSWSPASQLNRVLHAAPDEDTCATGTITVRPYGGIFLRFQLLSATGDTLLGTYIYKTEFNKDIPTLTEWGLIILALLAVAAVVWTVFRRKRVMVPA
jgi:hypothetical protein